MSSHTRSILRILIVEDHIETRETISRLLDHFGYEITSADSIGGALQLFEAREFDALLIDIGLPDGDGYDLVVAAKQRRHVCAVALTARDRPEDFQRGKEAGFDFYLTKPVDFAELRTILDQIAAEVSRKGAS